MAQKKFWLLILLANALYSHEQRVDELKKIPIIDFNSSIKWNLYKQKYGSSKSVLDLLNLYKQLYYKNHPAKVIPSKKEKIPKIIHQIWLGSNFPNKFKHITNKWIKMHPGWEYKLWTDQNIKELFPLYNQNYFDESTNFGEKTDILRYEILYRFGGIYVDVDYECLKSFEPLVYCYNFFAGVEPLDASASFIGNAFIACRPNNRILKMCIESLKNFRRLANIPLRTGPAHLTRCFCKAVTINNKNIIIFPPSFLYPLDYRERTESLQNYLKVKKESFGIHYWYGSWVKDI